jgi:hypothetical protein
MSTDISAVQHGEIGYIISKKRVIGTFRAFSDLFPVDKHYYLSGSCDLIYLQTFNVPNFGDVVIVDHRITECSTVCYNFEYKFCNLNGIPCVIIPRRIDWVEILFYDSYEKINVELLTVEGQKLFVIFAEFYDAKTLDNNYWYYKCPDLPNCYLIVNDDKEYNYSAKFINKSDKSLPKIGYRQN